MDYHALQQKLFALDPTDPREDLAKLQAQAQGAGAASTPTVPQVVTESVSVPEGSLPIDRDYSISDFAKLAGVQLNEAPQPQAAPINPQAAQKTGMGARMVGQKIGAKGSAGMMTKALDKVAQGGALPANLSQQIAPFAKQLETILGNQQLRNRFMQIVKQAEQMQQPKEAAKPKIKPRDPNAQYMNDLRSSGAMGAHKDKKKDAKSGKVKHKGKQYESIRSELEARLREFEANRK